MSISTLIGLFAGIAVFIGAIIGSTNEYLVFVNIPGFAIVLGGTVASTFISFPFEDVKRTFFSVWKIFTKHETTYTMDVFRFSKWAEAIKSKGISAIEDDIKKMKNSFMKDGLQLLVNGYKRDEIETNMESMINGMVEAQDGQTSMFKSMAAFAPAFGMIGTLIGLIIMLQGMGEDPATIGPAMAIALTTTLYGILLANLFLLPVAEKIRRRTDYEVLIRIIHMNGVLLLAEKRHPIYVENRLNSLIEPNKRFKRGKGKR